jgi:hypothetical protein
VKRLLHARQIGVCLSNRHSWSQPADQFKTPVAARIWPLLAIAADLNKDLRLIESVRPLNRLLQRQHARNLEVSTIQIQHSVAEHTTSA